jgi:hypothetical protein
LDVDVTAALAAAGSSHELQLWSAEQPSLYLLLIKLAAGGQLLEVEGCQVRGTNFVMLTALCRSRIGSRFKYVTVLGDIYASPVLTADQSAWLPVQA